ncbi:hypothetical protein LCGC14_0463900 [marine sediment metagenome]|uniref:Uncharacterized protein n=1 Tax=marine sediment metagenome TaxID=412755 RepID=A0A0F9SX53_9ZZZZ
MRKLLTILLVCASFIAQAQIEGILSRDCVFKQSIEFSDSIIKTIQKGEKLILFKLEDVFFSAEYEGKRGYIVDVCFKFTDEFLTFYEKELERVKKEEDEQRRIEIQQWHDFLITEFGRINANRILNHQYWIGMTAVMASNSLGSPKDINKSVGSWGVHEQWVYDNTYLYFENGILTSYQN